MSDREFIQEIVRVRPKFTVPEGWTRGELLAYQTFSGNVLFYRAGQPDNRDNIQFPSTLEANDFQGWWYAPMAVRAAEQIDEPVEEAAPIAAVQETITLPKRRGRPPKVWPQPNEPT